MLNNLLSSFVDLVRLGEPWDVEDDDDPFLLPDGSAASHRCAWDGTAERGQAA